MKFVKAERVWVKNHPDLSEKWIQNFIDQDPSVLGLGDVVVRDRERPQPRAGRLDLLLQDVETNRRYEVELQLGKTDESHIIRTIEYWDIERRRFPQYEHCAVIVAEDITSRFLNVISLFNGSIPLIAIQMQAVTVGDITTLLFTTVLDEVERGLVDEDEEVTEVVNRAYWEDRGTKKTVELADMALKLVKEMDPGLELKYNKYYIGLAKDGHPNNFVVFRAKKGQMVVEPRLPQSEDVDKLLSDAGLDSMSYDKRWRRYRLGVSPADYGRHEQVLRELLRRAYEEARS